MVKWYWKAVVVLAVLAPVLVLAQEVVAGVDPENLEVFLARLLAAVQGGQWQLVAILVGILLVWSIRKWGVKLWPALGSRRAGAITALLSGALPIIAAALLSGGGVSVNVIASAMVTGLGMIGGWVGVRRILFGDVEEKVAKEAAATVAPVPATASLDELRQELDR